MDTHKNIIKIILFSTVLSIIFLLVFLPVKNTYSQIVSEVKSNDLVDLANNERSAAGLSTLKYDLNLQMAAIAKAEDMAKNDYFEHYTPNGDAPWKFMIDNNYIYEVAGENLAIDFNNSKNINNAWMASPTHKTNILNPDYENIAIATKEDNFQGRKTIIVVEMFGKKSKDLSATINLVYYKVRSLLGLDL